MAFASRTNIETPITLPPVRHGQEADQPHASWAALETVGDVANDDISLLREAIDGSAEALVGYFDDDGLTEMLHRINVLVIVHALPGRYASETTATTRSGTRTGDITTYFAEIHMLAPSAHSPGLITTIGEPKDTAYFRRLIAHELSTIPLDLATRQKKDGWRFRSAPAWFVQGYEEYLGMTCSVDSDGLAAIDRRVQIVGDNPIRVDDAFGLDVQDAYVDGAVLLHFMHEQYGAETVRRILSSSEPTFGRAARAALGVDLTRFMQDWRDWLDRRKPD